MLATYYPEMGQAKPEADIEAQLSHYGKHWYLSSKVELRGRGVNFIRTLTATDFVDPNNRRIGWHEYKVTEAAFERICKEHSVSSEILL